MLRKLVSILFEEEEITIEEDLNETPLMVDIPKLEPMVEKKKPVIVTETLEVVAPKETPKFVEVTERKSMMIDVDLSEPEQEVQEPVVLTKFETKYQPKDIISPIFGGPKTPSEPIETKTYTNLKTRQPLTEIISPMFGKVEAQEQSSGIDASLLDIELSEMLSPIEEGEEVQATLFDYLEGFNTDEE